MMLHELIAQRRHRLNRSVPFPASSVVRNRSDTRDPLRAAAQVLPGQQALNLGMNWWESLIAQIAPGLITQLLNIINMAVQNMNPDHPAAASINNAAVVAAVTQGHILDAMAVINAPKA